jgi:V8-like Glu-specific endopeptidase
VRFRKLAAAASFVTAASLALLAAGAGAAFAVANGEPAKEGRYGFAAKIAGFDIPLPDGTTHDSGCSGALISSQWLMTAGHCFHDVNGNHTSGKVPFKTNATIGRTDDADQGGDVVDIVEDYQSPINDIAIAKLARPVKDVRPLALSHTAPKANEVLRIAGWGSLSDVNPTPATHLQTGQFTVTNVSTTVVNLKGFKPHATTSACLLDSGAPYFVEPTHGAPRLVSVESDGPACPDTGPEITSRVDTIALWANLTMSLHR